MKMAPTATSELKKAGTRADFSDISENQTPQKVAGAKIQDTGGWGRKRKFNLLYSITKVFWISHISSRDESSFQTVTPAHAQHADRPPWGGTEHVGGQHVDKNRQRA